MLVMNASENFCCDFIGLEEMMDVCSVVIFTTFAVAFWVYWVKIVGKLGVFDVDAAVVGIEGTISRHASRSDAIKSVATIFGAIKEVDGLLSHAEEVTWLVIWENSIDGTKHLCHAVGGKDATDAEAVWIHVGTEVGGLGSKIQECAALYYGVEILFVGKWTRLVQAGMLGDAACEPGMCALHGLFHVVMAFGFCQMVECYMDVCADVPLSLHG